MASTKSYFKKGYDVEYERLIRHIFRSFSYDKFMYNGDKTKIVGIMKTQYVKDLSPLRTTRMQIEEILESESLTFGTFVLGGDLLHNVGEYVDYLIDRYEDHKLRSYHDD